MKVLWFSCGVSSAIVAYLCKDELDEIIYQHIDDQHPDSLRFLHDVETLIGRKMTVEQSPYMNVENVCRSFGMIRRVKYAKCTDILKRRMRKNWESTHPGEHTYYWGMDCGETDRVVEIIKAMPKHDHRFPLIERQMIKEDCHGMIASLGVKRPMMYDLGYRNNNCIGCVKGGMWYWNKIRTDFPEVFASRAKLERDIGHSCIKGVFLDELDPNAGRDEKPIDMSCGIMCELALYGGE